MGEVRVHGMSPVKYLMSRYVGSDHPGQCAILFKAWDRTPRAGHGSLVRLNLGAHVRPLAARRAHADGL